MAASVTTIAELIGEIGGTKFKSQALNELPSWGLGQASLATLQSSLDGCIGAAKGYGVSLPITEYNEKFFTEIVSQLEKSAQQAGVSFGTDSSADYPIEGCYWYVNSTGDESRVYIFSLYKEKPTFESISVTTPPDRTTYFDGESFDASGMVVTGSYPSGETEVITSDSWEFSPSGQLTPANTDITITAHLVNPNTNEPYDLTTTQPITVIPKHDSLTSLFLDIANAIREKSGSLDTIIADRFPTYIRNLL